jgi:Fic family protein
MNYIYEQNKLEILKKIKFVGNKKLAIFHGKRERIEYVFNTSALEGNPMTFPEVQTLLEGITVGGHKLSDEQQILNQNKSVEKLFELVENSKFGLSKEIFCTLNSLVAENEALESGKFRSGMVFIGGTDHKPPKHDELNKVYEEGILKIENIENIVLKAISFFLFGALNQFFYDGNKRTSRLIMNGILLTNGLPLLNIKAKDRLEFNQKMIHFYDSKNATDILNYLLSYYYEQNKDLGFNK